MTRIRYKTNEAGELVSSPILVGNRNLEVVLGENFTYVIRVLDNKDEVVRTEVCRDTFNMKLRARRAIVDLGANIAEEKRPRKNKEVQIEESNLSVNG